jgi:hypothetical protein
MDLKLSSRTFVSASLFMAAIASAQETGPRWLNLRANDDNPAPINRFRLGYRLGFNINAKFKNVAGLTQVNDPGQAVSGANHNYDDGYNRVDRTGNNHGETVATWNWGYEHSGQVQGTTFIFMHSSSASAETVSERDGDPQMGLELSYNRQLGRIGKCFWGLEGAFNYTDVSIRDGQPADRSVSLTTDRYDLVGVTPPQPPYHGSFEGPGALINDVPTRTQSAAIATGVRKLGADVYAFRLGPYLQAPLGKRWTASFSAGVALAAIQSDFQFQETVVATSGETAFRSARDSQDEFLVGGYAAATLSYAINDSWSLFANAQYQYLGSYHQNLSDKQASVDLGKSVFVTFGAGLSF